MALAKTFGKYTPIAELGRGGMAVVYLAALRGPGGFSKLAVVKELKEEMGQDPEFGTMFLDEARLAARLNHPNIVQTFEVDQEDGRFFLVMEYLEGHSFSAVRSRLSKLGTLTRDHQVRVICDVLDGLAYAHDLSDYGGAALNVVHRDVSPHNVIITYAGETKLVDFGIAKTADQSSQTRTGVIKGKLAYMAPEQAFGHKVDCRADIFAVGVMLWEAITGKRMWKGMAEGAIAHRLSTGEIPKIAEHLADPPPALLVACERAVAPRVEDRYPTATAMRQDLEAYLATLKPQPTARDLGRLVSVAFEEERARLSSVIEEQMTLLRSLGARLPDGEIPQVAAPIVTITPSASQPSSSVASLAGSVPSVVSAAPASAPASAPAQGPYSIKWLVAGGVLILLLGAAVTTALMAPWSAGAPRPASPAPAGTHHR